MDASDIEKKIKGTVEFILTLFTSAFYFLFPFFLVRTLKKSADKITPPYTFLAILAFFGLKLWSFVFLKHLVNDSTEIPGHSIKVTQTTAETLNVLDFIGIPSWEEIIMLTIPYMIMTIALAKLCAWVTKRLDISFGIPPDQSIIYFSGFLILVFPLMLIVADQKWEIPLLLSLPLYLFMVFQHSMTDKISFRFISFMSGYAVIVPAAIISFMYLTLWTGTTVFSKDESVFSETYINRYKSADLFNVKLMDLYPEKETFKWKVLLKSNDTEHHSYQVHFKPGSVVYNEDTTTICRIESITGDKIFNSAEPTTLEVTTTFLDTAGRHSDYFFTDLCIIDRTKFDAPTSTILLWKLGKHELMKPKKEKADLLGLGSRFLKDSTRVK
ncbi:MAG: hypothetical protein HYZ14_07430 [Bacteroidetes bacterium]|nr:hypothetical protein [Bacteroidota bacterium]